MQHVHTLNCLQSITGVRYSWKVAGSIPDEVIGIIQLHIPSGRLTLLTEISTEGISWGAGAYG